MVRVRVRVRVRVSMYTMCTHMLKLKYDKNHPPFFVKSEKIAKYSVKLKLPTPYKLYKNSQANSHLS